MVARDRERWETKAYCLHTLFSSAQGVCIMRKDSDNSLDMASTVGSARRMAVLSGHVLLQPASNRLDAVDVADASAELKRVRRQGHSVPDAIKQEGSSAVVYFENHARRLSHAGQCSTR